MHRQNVCRVLVQNEVAYEYFGDRFSVTAERMYKQVHTAIQYVLRLTACANACECLHVVALTSHLSLIHVLLDCMNVSLTELSVPVHELS